MTRDLTPRWEGPLPIGMTFLEDDAHLPRAQRRLLMTLDARDSERFEQFFAEEIPAVVLDLRSGWTFSIRRADCGLGCRCAALARWIQPVEEEDLHALVR